LKQRNQNTYGMICHGNGLLAVVLCWVTQDYHALNPLPAFLSTSVSGN
jgi:hypothetical protein